mmetsp:Transcript_46052/g.75081  ORF Transcript_46052/g.75081 Transcript_46052/m.75081 type:complete len:87 (-) Transcript_46052:225-485(-)
MVKYRFFLDQYLSASPFFYHPPVLGMAQYWGAESWQKDQYQSASLGPTPAEPLGAQPWLHTSIPCPEAKLELQWNAKKNGWGKNRP